MTPGWSWGEIVSFGFFFAYDFILVMLVVFFLIAIVQYACIYVYSRLWKRRYDSESGGTSQKDKTEQADPRQ